MGRFAAPPVSSPGEEIQMLSIAEFVVIDTRIDAAEEQATDSLRESLRDRWEFGRLMLAAREGKKRLPNNFLADLVKATGKSESELGYRMQFAVAYPTETELPNALGSFTSWGQVIRSLPKPDKPKPPPKPKPKPAPKRDDARLGDAIRDREAEGASYTATDVVEDVAAQGLDISIETAQRAMREERSAQTAMDEAPAIDWQSMPGTVQQKLEAATRRIRRELEREFQARRIADADQYRAQCDENVKAYKVKLDAQAKVMNQLRDEERQRYELTLNVYRAKGLITPDEYQLIRSCLHPDSRISVTDEKLAAAFRVFNDERVKILLVKEPPAPKRPGDLPETAADLRRRGKK